MSVQIEVRQKPGTASNNQQFSTGANTEILIDGKVVPFVTKFNLEIEAGGIAKATIEMVGAITVNVIGEFEQKTFNVQPSKESADA